MRSSLSDTENDVKVLRLSGISLLDLDNVSSWMLALDMAERDCIDGCRQIMADGEYAFSNVRHRVSVVCGR